RLLAKAAELNDLATIRQVISVAITNYRRGDESILDELFLPAIAILTRKGDASWIFDAWFRREVRDVFSLLNERAINLVLENLMSLPEIDYHAEELLCAIAMVIPQRVLSFLRERINVEADERRDRSKRFEAIPFEFHKLQGPLSTIPRVAVQLMR